MPTGRSESERTLSRRGGAPSGRGADVGDWNRRTGGVEADSGQSHPAQGCNMIPVPGKAARKTMWESGYKVHPLLTAIRPGRAGKQAVCVWESGVEQGDQIVFKHGLCFGALLGTAGM